MAPFYAKPDARNKTFFLVKKEKGKDTAMINGVPEAQKPRG